MILKRDQIIGIGLVMVGVFFSALISRFSIPITADYPGPKMLPAIAVFGLMVCGIGIFTQSTVKQTKEKLFLGKDGWIRIGITFLILSSYVLGLKYLGYLLSTPFLLFATTSIFAKEKSIRIRSKVFFSIVLTVVVYLIYVQLFKLSLPSGSIF